MLSRIIIKNFALIDSLDISLSDGLQVITGETGAGKSIILGALRLILGERADLKTIAKAEEKSVVEAEFLLNNQFKKFFIENDLDYEDLTLIRREMLPSGKSRAFINDVPVTLDVLKEFTENLIDIHSQFETSNLFNEDYQFRIIDGLSENKTLIIDYQQDFAELQHLKRQLSQLENQLSEGNRESDYKKFLLSELEEADLDHLNWEDLQSQVSTFENAESISENLSQIFIRTDQEEVGLLDIMNDIRSKMSKVGTLSHLFTELEQRLESNFLEFKDILFELQNEAENIEANPQLLEDLNGKINKINALFLKHQSNSVEELIEIRNQIAQEQSGFEDVENQIVQTEKQISEKQKVLEKTTEKLSKNRKKAIPVFITKMEALLKDLGLEKAKLDVPLTPDSEFSKFGKEKIEILFQANSGFPLKPIQTAISGGERSRVMLAVKKIMAENAALPTLILDEIDTGVSGKIASEMGKVMKEMTENMQLIVITHLAQVAAKGSQNYKVLKNDVNGRTQSNIVVLNQNEKLHEIAQLLSGSEITDAALEQAKQLMK